MIRICTSEDFPAIHSVINDAASAYKGVIPPDCFHDPYMSEDELRCQIGEGVRFWGWEEDNELVAVMGIQDVGEVTLIRHAYVRTERRGSGIGGELLQHLLGLTEKPVLVGTWADAWWAVAFYAKHGFEPLSRHETRRLLTRYWSVPERQAEMSVVLKRPA